MYEKLSRRTLGKAAGGLAAAAMAVHLAPGAAAQEDAAPTVEEQTVAEIVGAWPETPQQVAKEVMNKYGPPNEATASMLIWHNNRPWKRTILFRDEVPHDFPMPHTDLLEQFIDYQVPPEKFDELAQYDGSVIVERTKGELSARCDKEAMNLLALNLANDIVTGKRSVEEARQFYGETAMAFKQGESAPYVEGLQFEVPEGKTEDPDKTTVKA